VKEKGKELTLAFQSAAGYGPCGPSSWGKRSGGNGKTGVRQEGKFPRGGEGGDQTQRFPLNESE